MAMETVITISRQYGSGGRFIGRKLAEALGIPFYDKELITMAAEESGMSKELFEKADEKAGSSLLYTLSMNSYLLHGMAGVPDAACESQSRSTYENAVLTKKALEASHPRSVMLVTSWFHSRRALAVFRNVWPEVAFGVHPVYAGATFTARFRIYEMGYIFSEYVKTLWYMVRYGIA